MTKRDVALAKLNDDLRYSLGAFARYMNRPLARVQVYTWRLACRLATGTEYDNGGSIRIRPAYRSAQIRQWRKETANFIKLMRQNRRNNWQTRIVLPVYDKATGRYTFSN